MDKIIEYIKAFIDTVLNINKNGRNYTGCVEARVYLFLPSHCEVPIFQKYFTPVL
jgi:hypothetical protein